MDQFKFIAFDVDGTVATGNVWQKVHALAGVTPEEDNEWFSKYYAGEITNDQWGAFINERYAVCGVHRRDFEKAMDTITLVPGAKHVIEVLKRQYPLCLVSSGIDYYVAKVARMLGISEYYANYFLVYNDEGIVQSVGYDGKEEESKVKALKEIVGREHISPEEIVYVGDASNDLAAFAYTKHGILVGKGNEELVKAAWKQVKNLDEIPGLLL